MKFKHYPESDGAGSLAIHAETPEEVKQLQDHFKIFRLDELDQVVTFAETLKKGRLVHWIGQRSDRGTALLPVSVAMPTATFEPYAKLMQNTTGWDCRQLQLERTTGLPWLGHHFHLTRMWLDRSELRVEGFANCYGDKRSPVDPKKVIETFKDYLQEHLGDRKHEPEMIPKGNGGYYPNPNYLRQHKAHPATSNNELWRWLFDYWRANHARPEQLRALAGQDELAVKFNHHWGRAYDLKGRFGGCCLSDYHLHYRDEKGTCNYDGKGYMVSVINWSDFAKL